MNAIMFVFVILCSSMPYRGNIRLQDDRLNSASDARKEDDAVKGLRQNGAELVLNEQGELLSVNLSTIRVDDEIIGWLVQHPEIQDLDLTNTAVTDISFLRSLRSVRKLNLTGLYRLRPESIDVIQDMRDLRLLALQVTPADASWYSAIAKHNTKLERLVCTAFSADEFRAIGEISSLTSLSISSGEIHGDWVIPFKNLRKLKSIGLSVSIKDSRGIRALAELPDLEEAWLHGPFRQEDIDYLKRNLPDASIHFP